jgi:hypothetical protein
MGSLVTRLANDIIVDRGSDEINQDNVIEYLPVVNQYLFDSPKSTNFSKTGWQSIGEHFDHANESTENIVIDSADFIRHPSAVLGVVCDSLGLEYNPGMTNDWKKDFTNLSNGNNEAETRRSAWTKDAANNTSIVSAKRGALNIDSLPAQMQQHITDVAIPVYKKLISGKILK